MKTSLIYKTRRAVREQREFIGMTQAELAAAIGVHVDTILKIENGTAPLDLHRLEELADALGLFASELVALAEDHA